MYFICIMTRNCQNQIKTCFKRTMLVQIMLFCYVILIWNSCAAISHKIWFLNQIVIGMTRTVRAVPQGPTTRVEGLARFFLRIKTFEIFIEKTWKTRYSICDIIWTGNYWGIALKNLNRYSNIFEKDSFLFVKPLWLFVIIDI